MLHTQLENFINQNKDSHFDRLVSNSYKELVSDKFLLSVLVQIGIPIYLFQEIKDNCTLKDNQWATFLDMKNKTFEDTIKNKQYVFPSNQSNKILQVLEVTIFGTLIFDSNEKLDIWLNTSLPIYQYKKPLELMQSSFGKDLIMNEISNIKYGLFL